MCNIFYIEPLVRTCHLRQAYMTCVQHILKTFVLFYFFHEMGVKAELA